MNQLKNANIYGEPPSQWNIGIVEDLGHPRGVREGKATYCDRCVVMANLYVTKTSTSFLVCKTFVKMLRPLEEVLGQLVQNLFFQSNRDVAWRDVANVKYVGKKYFINFFPFFSIFI